MIGQEEKQALEAWLAMRTELVDADRLIVNDDGTITYTLDERFTVAGEEIAKATVRRPKGKDLKAMGKAAADAEGKTFELVSRLTGIEPVIIGEMDGADFLVLAQVATDFLEKRPLTGKTPSA